MTTPQLSVDLQRHRKIIGTLREGVLVIGADQKLLWANDAALTMHGVTDVRDLGVDADEYRRLFRLQFRNKHRLGSADYPFDRALAGDAFDNMIVEVTPDGEEEPRWLHQIRSLILPDKQGDVEQIVLVIQDVSLRFEAEHRFEQTFNVNPAPALIMRLADQHFVKVNQGFLDLTGFARDEVLGRTLYDIDILKDAAQLEIAKERLREGRTVPQMQADLELPDGGRKLVIVAGQPVDLDEEPCMLFSFADLEPRRQAENELRHSEERFFTTFRLAPVAMAITTRDERVVCDTNEAFHQLAGWSADEAMGKTMSALRLWADASFVAAVDKDLAGASAFRGKDAQLTGKDGGVTDCLVSAAAIPLRRETCILWVVQDIHERRHSELELIGAIEEVMKDANSFSRAVVEKLANLRAPTDAPRPAETSELTRREKEVLSLLCEGGDDATVAREMGVSRNTLRNHIARVYAKIGVNRRAQAVLWARERGYPLQRPIR